MKRRLLFITSIYRVGERVYPVIPRLAEVMQVDVLFNGQMSPTSPWHGDFDLRQSVFKSFRKLCKNVFSGVPYPGGKKASRAGMLAGANPVKYHAVMFDDNAFPSRFGTGKLYNVFKELKIPIITCPHGNTNYKTHLVNGSTDYSFVFGEKDKRQLSGHHMWAAGIPSNDILKDYPRRNKHLLIIPSLFALGNRVLNGIQCFTPAMIRTLKLREIAEKYECSLVIKCKSRFPSRHQNNQYYAPLYKLGGVKVLLDVVDDNQLIADSKIVISCPSTMAFKPIQLGIPTVLLDHFGQIGSLQDWPGRVQATAKDIRRGVDGQMNAGRNKPFIRDVLSGGEDFTATQLYVSTLTDFLQNLV